METIEEAAVRVRVAKYERLLTIKLYTDYSDDSEAATIFYMLPGVRVGRNGKHFFDGSNICFVSFPESLYGEDCRVAVRLMRNEKRHILLLGKLKKGIYASDPILEDVVTRARGRKKSKRLQAPKKKGHGSPKKHPARREKQDDDIPGPPTTIKSEGGLAAK